MKRVISLALVFVVVLWSLAVPVLAADSQGSNFVNVLDYCTPNDSDGYFVVLDAGDTATFTLPYRTYIRYVDFVVRSSSTISSASVTINSTTNSLNVESIGNGCYRFYGSVSGDLDTIVVDFENTSKLWVEFLSFKISHVVVDSWEAEYEVGFQPLGKSMSWKEGTDSAYVGWSVSASDVGGLSSYEVYVDVLDWTKYDYISFSFDTQFSTITSIQADVDGLALPASYSMLDSGVSDASDDTLSASQAGSVIIDLREVNRSDAGVLRIIVDGQFNLSTGVTFYAHAPIGMIDADTTNPAFAWFRTLLNDLDGWFSSVISAITGDSGAADEFNSSMESQIGELEEIGDAMDSVTKPPIEDMSGSVDDFVSSDDINAAGSVFAAVFSDGPIFTVFLISLTLALVSYVLYGKR